MLFPQNHEFKLLFPRYEKNDIMKENSMNKIQNKICLYIPPLFILIYLYESANVLEIKALNMLTYSLN